MTLNQIVALTEDTIFQKQIQAASVAHAMQVLAAGSTEHGVADEKMWWLANSTIADGGTANLNRFVWAIASTPGFDGALNDTNNTNDAAISSAMVSQWGNIAGVTGGDLGK
jgi:hypothetical protein